MVRFTIVTEYFRFMLDYFTTDYFTSFTAGFFTVYGAVAMALYWF